MTSPDSDWRVALINDRDVSKPLASILIPIVEEISPFAASDIVFTPEALWLRSLNVIITQVSILRNLVNYFAFFYLLRVWLRVWPFLIRFNYV